MDELGVREGSEFFVCDGKGPFPKPSPGAPSPAPRQSAPPADRPTLNRPTAQANLTKPRFAICITASSHRAHCRFSPPPSRGEPPARREPTSSGSVAGVTSLTSMSVGELKAVIKAGGYEFTDCVEKSDLVARATEARAKPKLSPSFGRPSAAKSNPSGEQTLRVAINMPGGAMVRCRTERPDTDSWQCRRKAESRLLTRSSRLQAGCSCHLEAPSI